MKRTLGDLAIFGGASEFNEQLHVGRPNIPDKQILIRRIEDLLDSKWLTNDGPYLQQFEKRIAELVGVRNCIATCNGTVALEILARAAGLKGEVILPSFTFIATAHSLKWVGVQPVFCDIESETQNLDPDKLERLITNRTTAIMGVHLWGRPCNIDRLVQIALKHKLQIFFDASHAFGCSYQGRMIGSFGNAEVFSFHATKFLNTFEGGAIVTNDDQLADQIRLMRSFGFADYDSVVSIGTNGKMNEVCAAMGMSCLDEMEHFIAANQRNYERYREALPKVPGLSMIHYDGSEKNNFQYVVLEIEEEAIGLSRDEILSILWKENILARRYFYPGCHKMEPYRSLFPNASERLPITEQAAKQVLCLPTGTAIGVDDVTKVCEVLTCIVHNADEIGRRFHLTFKESQPSV
jgi:dTDP-4-amino-4,6-dideoxygalactose transaminase